MSEHILRYYERIGLIMPIRRAANGHRRYSSDDIDWVIFARCLRSAGMPIATVQRYVALQRQGSTTLPERLALLRQHRDAVRAQIAELTEHLTVMEHKIAYYAQLEDPDDDACP